jgi:hypothetical protein
VADAQRLDLQAGEFLESCGMLLCVTFACATEIDELRAALRQSQKHQQVQDLARMADSDVCSTFS